MADVTTVVDRQGAGYVRFHDEADGTYSMAEASHLRYWDTGTLSWQRVTGTGGAISTSGGAGGGAATIADGADVAQGTTTDLSSASTVIGLLKNLKAALAGSLTVNAHNVTNAGTFAVQGKLIDTAGVNAAAVSAAGRLSVDASGVAVPITDNAGSLTVDAPVATPVASRLSDGAAFVPTVNNADADAGRIGLVVDARNRVWNGATWDRTPGGTDGTTVRDGGNSLTVDAPVGTPAFVRLSDGAAAIATLPVSAASLPLPAGASTSANQSAVKAASTLAGATDTSQVVTQSPMRADASNLAVTATAAVNTALTLTLPAAAAGLFHYITSIQIVKLYSVVGIAAGAGVIITTTNLPGSPAWTTEQLASAAGTAATVVNLLPGTPLKSSVAATATTIVCPQQLQTIWRVNVTYFTAP